MKWKVIEISTGHRHCLIREQTLASDVDVIFSIVLSGTVKFNAQPDAFIVIYIFFELEVYYGTGSSKQYRSLLMCVTSALSLIEFIRWDSRASCSCIYFFGFNNSSSCIKTAREFEFE